MPASVVLRRLTHAALAAALAAATLQSGSAAAAPPDSPVITLPNEPSNPDVEIAWEPVAGATNYEVRVDDDPAFGSPESTTSTVNTVVVPTRLFATGTWYSSVRARNSAGESSAWTSSSFTVNGPEVPGPTAPADGAELENPSEPPLLTWTPVAAATTYTVEVDTEDQFIGAATYTTKSNSLVVPADQAPATRYYWRVQANLPNGVSSDRSVTQSYTVLPIRTPTTVGPAHDEDVTDVVLDWEPVPGAKHYELEVDDDVEFGSPDPTVPTRIYGTSYSPPTTFTNGQYYWRVRARDLDNNTTPWVRTAEGSAFFFDRVWRDRPQLVHPYDATGNNALQEVHDDLYFEWEPVPHASNYELWVSTDPNFTEPTTSTNQCMVAGTTFTPGEVLDRCMPSTEGIVHYWKVRPMDLPYSPTGVEGIFSATQKFVYTDQEFISISAPAAGATVAVPTLDWAPVPSTTTYSVELFQGSISRHKATTHSTSYTPLGYELNPANGTQLTWEISAVDNDRRTSLLTSRSFTWDPTLIDTSTPLVLGSGPATYDAPNLHWDAVAGADYYEIDIADDQTGNLYADSFAPILSKKLYFPAATDTEVNFLNTGRYRWWVTAYSEQGAVLDYTPAGEYGTFEVMPLGPVTGHRLALTGSALDRGDACTKTLSDGADQTCDGVPATPVLDWEPVPYAAEYRIRIARDPDFTNSELDALTPPRTVNTRWAPSFSYPFRALEESQANKAYYWFIQPCKSPTQCGPDPKSVVNLARHAFKKTSPAVKLVSPASGFDNSATELTFEWEDYYATNQAVTYAATGETSYQSAQSYRLQVATDDAFTEIVDDVVVDQPTYTAADTLYPQGPLHWRVQAIDANDNALAFSATRSVDNQSPKPVLQSPVNPTAGDVPEVSGAVPFLWEAQPFAGTYTIQVAANNDANFSSGNLKVNTSTRRAAFTTGLNSGNMLAPSETPYVWRVRRNDPDGNPGPWSDVARFKVVMSVPDLQSPAADEVVGPRGLVLTWAPIAEAATYRVEYRKLNATSSTPVTTPAPAYAPTAALTVNTTYEWRVTTINASNQAATPGAWRRFTVGGAPVATVRASISGSAVLGTQLDAVDPQWSVPGVTNTYQWQRNGAPIGGATSSSYDVAVADVDQQITVVVTGTAPEFGTGMSTSEAVTGKPGAGPDALTTPQISGSGQVGSTLSATLPEWDPSDTVVSLQWQRNGTDISGATKSTYEVTSGDLNTSITLVVTGTLPGRTPTRVTSNSIGASQGPAARAVTPPTISGTPTVGSRLSSSAPSWDVPGVVNHVEWLRNGVPISMATLSTYVVKSEDVGALLSVRYTGSVPGRADGVSVSSAVVGLSGATTPPPTTSPVPEPTQAPAPSPAPTQAPAPAPVGPVASTTVLKAPMKAKVGKRARVTVTVRASGVSSPTGVVKIYAGKKLVAKVRLEAGAEGVVKARLAKLKKGRYRLRAVYSGSSTVDGSRSKRVVLRVTR